MRRRDELPVEVHRLRPLDEAAAAVRRIDAACFAGAEGTDIMAELARPYTHAWVAKVPVWTGPEAWVGYILTWLVADEVHVLNVATQPSHRRRGIGRALVQRALAFARRERARLVLLEVRRSNQAAIRLYRSFGFSVAGLRRAYYSLDGEDALEMVLVLDPETGDIVPGQDEVRLEEV